MWLERKKHADIFLHKVCMYVLNQYANVLDGAVVKYACAYFLECSRP